MRLLHNTPILSHLIDFFVHFSFFALALLPSIGSCLSPFFVRLNFENVHGASTQKHANHQRRKDFAHAS